MSLESLLLIGFILVWVIQIIFFGLIYSKLAFYRSPSPVKKSLPVSILVCARNESYNLRRLLPLLLDQDYDLYELILINDASTDNSLEIMQQFAQKSERLKIINNLANEHNQGDKKHALSLGIESSNFKHLLLTDADCRPCSKLWISKMSAHFSEKHEIVLGYGAYSKINASLLNKLIRFETLVTAMQYFSMALLKMPYMGVGRNLGYNKGLFIKNNGFKSHNHIRSGDDDLFVNASASAYNTTICIDKEAFTLSQPKTTFKEWVLQKRRHISTANYYKNSHKLILGGFYLTQISLYILVVCLLIMGVAPAIIILLFGFRFLLQTVITAKIAHKLDENDLIIYLPLLEILLIGFHFYIFICNIISKPKHWN